jgi:hypothetical protein
MVAFSLAPSACFQSRLHGEGGDPESRSAPAAHSFTPPIPRRLRLWNFDRLLLLCLYRLYPSQPDAIVIIQPDA